jgi:uncharacterized glyoxalase superfamily protein PhnB/predicted enzyme related to lactoylglutathione lyase
MSDPFDALRRPDAPIAPSAAFASQLRQRLTAELQPLLDPPITGAAVPSAITERTFVMTVTPYFSVRNCAAALDFYRDAFGAVETQRLVGDDGRIGHAEIVLGGSRMMLADEYPEVDSLGPESRGGPTCAFDLDVGDAARVDAMHAHVLELGGRSLREPADQFHGSRSAVVQDPFGHRWTLSALIEQLSAEQYADRAAQDNGHGGFSLELPEAAHPQARHHEQGDLYYFTLSVPDLPKAQRFFGAVLGWRFGAPDQGHIENISAPPGGLNDKSGQGAARLWFVVDDVHTAVERVRAAGGTAEDPVNYESGWSADCTDDQGTAFSLSVPSPEYSL